MLFLALRIPESSASGPSSGWINSFTGASPGGQAEFWGPEGVGVCLKGSACAERAPSHEARPSQSQPHSSPATEVKIFEAASQEECTEQARECVESIGEDLVDQLFNSSEKRLARILFLLAHFGKEGRAEIVLSRIKQEDLAQMVGTTRSRINHFMKKFRKLGFVDYSGGLTVHGGLLSVVLLD
jgi:predicted XRE-type DNA-binding protein